MITLVSSLLSAWVVLHWCGALGRWPWRVADLAPGARPNRPGPARATSLWTRRSGRLVELGRRRGATHQLSTRQQSTRQQSTRRRIEADLAHTVDLLHVAVTAGHTIHTAVAAVGRDARGPVSVALGGAAAQVEVGVALVDALEAMADELGPTVRPLVTTLVVCATSGAPAAAALQRLADAERRRERRRCERRVRRLPVLTLIPLVLLVLPAFVLLTIVPVALATAGSALTPL